VVTDLPFSLNGRRVFVAGHRGMVGRALLRRLAAEDCEIVTADREALDLRDRGKTEAWIAAARPDAVFLAAAKVGGILANDSHPGDFLYDNLMIATNVIEASRKSGVAKLLFVGSSAVYPRLAPQPIEEESLLSGPLEPTHQWYAIAKIAAIKLCQAYRRQHGFDCIAALPTNLYGPGDRFDLASGHVVPSLIRKAHEAKARGDAEIVMWGTGMPRREFLHVDDCADALVHLMKNYSDASPINVGSGADLTIRALLETVCRVAGYEGRITADPSKPDGPPRKLLSVARLAALGWHPRIGLEEGLRETYAWFVENCGDGR
jgi:GDP-L-fucose synthase